LDVQLGDYKETMEEAGLSKSRTESLARDLQAEIEELKDLLDEEEERNRDLTNFKVANKNAIQDLKRALDREIAARETLENEKRVLERDNQELRDNLDEERVSRGNNDRELRRVIAELDDVKSRLTTLNSSISKLENAKQRAEEDHRQAKKKIFQILKKDLVNWLLK